MTITGFVRDQQFLPADMVKMRNLPPNTSYRGSDLPTLNSFLTNVANQNLKLPTNYIIISCTTFTSTTKYKWNEQAPN